MPRGITVTYFNIAWIRGIREDIREGILPIKPGIAEPKKRGEEQNNTVQNPAGVLQNPAVVLQTLKSAAYRNKNKAVESAPAEKSTKSSHSDALMTSLESQMAGSGNAECREKAQRGIKPSLRFFDPAFTSATRVAGRTGTPGGKPGDCATSAIVREVHEKCHANPKFTAKILGLA